jgi:hypothetical protein
MDQKKGRVQFQFLELHLTQITQITQILKNRQSNQCNP